VERERWEKAGRKGERGGGRTNRKVRKRKGGREREKEGKRNG